MTVVAPRVAVLSYHKIGISPGDWESWYYVPQPLLEEHVGLLVEQGWQPIDPDSLLAGLADPGSLPELSFLITFDDAYRSLLVSALPWLVANQVPAVVFVPTGYVGGMNEFDRDVEPEEPILGWDDLRTVHGHGVSIQSHGVSHSGFSELSVEECRAELLGSKAALEEVTGAAVRVLSYPYGDPGSDPAATASLLRAAGYGAAFGYGGGPFAVPAVSCFLLPRIAMGPDTDLRAELAQA